MKNLTLLALAFSCLFFACTENKSDLPTPQEETLAFQDQLMVINETTLALYKQLEDQVILHANNMDALYTLYLAHVNLIGEKQDINQQDIEQFIAQHQNASFKEVFKAMNEDGNFTDAMLTTLEEVQANIKDQSLTQRLDHLTTTLTQIQSIERMDLVVQILSKYSEILKKEFQDPQTQDRDCQSDCRHTNIYYGAYYPSYYSYLNSCGYYCPAEAEGYAHDCGWLACYQYCN